MSDHQLDALIRLYQQHAQERAPLHLDARILAAAERRSSRYWRYLAWPVGLAAMLCLAIAVYRPSAMPTTQAASHAAPHFAADNATTRYLMQMDLRQADSATAQYLNNATLR